MKKLTNEEMFKLTDKIISDMFPNEKQEDHTQKVLAKSILSMLATFMIEYQEEIEK